MNGKIKTHSNEMAGTAAAPAPDPNPPGSLHPDTFPHPGVGRLLTRNEAMARLRITGSHFSKIVHGKVKGLPPVPTIMIGRRQLFRPEALDQWIIDVEALRCKGAR